MAKKMKKNKNSVSKIKKEKRSIKNMILIALMFAGIALLSIVFVFALYIIISAPDFTADKFYNKESTILYDINGDEFATLGAENRELVSYEDLPQVLVDAIVATEDARFFQHSGFDLARFAKASIGQLVGKSGAGGASTLSMQVSKNNLTDTDESIIRKFTDIYMAVFKIEKKFTKEEIIEFYVNKPYLGNYSYGIEQASWGYFGKSVKDLNLSEAALLAGMFQAPGAYDPYVNPRNAEARRRTVLELMVKHSFISDDEANFADNIPIESMLIGNSGTSQNKYQGYIDTVVQEIIDKFELNPYNVPMEIYTTMDPEVQDVLNALINEELQMTNGKTFTFDNDTIQAALVVTGVKDGSIVAVGSGRNKTDKRQLNLATTMNRQPGSSIKPFMDYAPYLEYNNGSTYSLFFDEVTYYGTGKSIQNADGKYNGMMTMKTALASSRNTTALQAFKQLDTDKISSFLHSVGINHGNDLYESAAVGAFNGVSPLQMSAAYAMFARGGYYIEPYSYTKIVFRDTGNEEEHKPKREKVLSEESAYMINYILQYAATSLKVGGNIKSNGDFATKGGTTTFDEGKRKSLGYPASAAQDSWMNAYNTEYALSVWYGYEFAKEGRYITASTGNTARQSITSAVASKIFKSTGKFNIPSGVTKVTIEYETIPPQLPSAYTPNELKITEYFRKGTEPTDVSPRFDTLANAKNGSATSTGSQIYLTWDKAPTPEAVDTASLQSYFNKGYGDYATKYYERRINYNNNNIGTFGYDIYLKKSDNTLSYLGFTSSNSYTYTSLGAGEYTFVVKSAYSKFKSNASSGLVITTSSSSGSGGGSTSGISIVVNGQSTVCVVHGTSYHDGSNPITILDSSSNNVTGNYSIQSVYYKVNADNSLTELSGIPSSPVGSYRVGYKVTGSGDTKWAYRNVNVKNSCP